MSKVYILYGFWDNGDYTNSAVIKTSYSYQPCRDKLDEIIMSNGQDYLEQHGYLGQDIGNRYYRVFNGMGSSAEFHIEECEVDGIPSAKMYFIGGRDDKEDSTCGG